MEQLMMEEFGDEGYESKMEEDMEEDENEDDEEEDEQEGDVMSNENVVGVFRSERWRDDGLLETSFEFVETVKVELSRWEVWPHSRTL